MYLTGLIIMICFFMFIFVKTYQHDHPKQKKEPVQKKEVVSTRVWPTKIKPTKVKAEKKTKKKRVRVVYQ